MHQGQLTPHVVSAHHARVRARSRRYQPIPEAPKVAAIYCRISLDKEERFVGVDRQERECRETAERLGYQIREDYVFVDNSKSAWQRNRKRPGWDQMLDLLEKSEFDAVIAYHPDRLMRQPRDLEDLLDGAALSQRNGRPVQLVGSANNRDLSNPDDIFVLRIEIAQAAKSSDDTSRRMKTALKDKAAGGSAHGGRRAFGYKNRNMEIHEPEAEIIRDVAGRILNGEPIAKICRELNQDGIRTANGKHWSNATLWSLMTGPRIAGFRQHQGQIVGNAQWPAIIDPAVWSAICDNADTRATTFNENGERTKRYYLMRGLLSCGKCGHKLSGEMLAKNNKPTYRCVKRPGTDRCGQMRIMCEQLDAYLVEIALSRLEKVKLNVRTNVAVDPEVERLNAEDAVQLQELAMDWARKDLDRDSYHAARKIIQERMAARSAEGPVVQRSLTGLTGPGVRKKWLELEPERQTAVMRDVFDHIRVLPAPVSDRFVERGHLDPNRVQVTLSI